MSLTPTDPILILSDLHLGHRASLIKHPDQLAPILDGPGSVIFNGDTSEMRNPEDRQVGRKLAADLARICHQGGRKAFFVNGNHDPTVSSINHLDLANGAVLVTHGDILFLDVAPWSHDARHYRKKHREILDGLGPDAYADFEKRLLASKRTSIELQMLEAPLTRGRSPGFRLLLRNCWPPWRPLMIIKAWSEVPGRAADLAQRLPAGGKICHCRAHALSGCLEGCAACHYQYREFRALLRRLRSDHRIGPARSPTNKLLPAAIRVRQVDERIRG